MKRATRTFLFVSLVLLMATLSFIAEPQPAVELVVTMEKEVYKLDEQITFAVDVINHLDEPVEVEFFFRLPRIICSNSGKAIEGRPMQVVINMVRALPGERVRLFEISDLNSYFVLAEPGQYTLEGAADLQLLPPRLGYKIVTMSALERPEYTDESKARLDQFRSKHSLPQQFAPNYSAPVAFKLKGGKARPEDLAASRWRERLPEKGWLAGGRAFEDGKASCLRISS